MVDNDDRYKFSCPACGKQHLRSYYCIAQQAQGHIMYYQCGETQVEVPPLPPSTQTK